MAGEEEDKKADEDKDLELDLMAEAELLRLTRQYRIMEGDKEAYCEEAQKVLRRQRKILTDLGTYKSLELFYFSPLFSDHIYLWSVVSGVAFNYSFAKHVVGRLEGWRGGGLLNMMRRAVIMIDVH